FFRALSDTAGLTDDATLTDALWDLLWAGHLTNDTLAPLRARLSGGRTTHRSKPAAPRARYGGGRYAGLRAARGAGRAALPSRSGPPVAAGRWSLLPPREADATLRAHAGAEVLLERHGVVTRGAVGAERVPGGFAAVYRVLSAFEDAGRVRRGYFVEGLGAAQFGTTGAVDRLRASARPVGDGPADGLGDGYGEGFGDGSGRGSGGAVRDTSWRTVVLAAADPANPYGAALPWPDRPERPDRADPADRAGAADGPAAAPAGAGHKPGRKAGALVVLVDGALVLYVERGGRSLLSFTASEPVLQSAADALALSVRDGALGRLTVERADGEGVLSGEHPLARALAAAGFHATPRGLRLRA
ncbi:MAG: DEAD/DEAH box helicase, partial [Actinobacteria bacterium]|nr:DEAD/DEAH box helicase [Actinomycetota bacterium]